MPTATAHEIRAAYQRRETRPSEIVEAALAEASAVDGRVHAFLKIDAERARSDAAAWDRYFERNPAGAAPPLAGIPIALKDNVCVRGMPTTCGSRVLEGWIPPYDATVVERLREAGAIIIGKTNLDEFAMGSSTEHSAFGPTRNPWDLSRVPGGSSGGSAAAVAAGVVPIALGSDTGGSIRLPAGFCGITGLKPTYGRVSRYGLVAFASSLDQIGPMAADVEDTALLLGALSGHDSRDSTSVRAPVPDYVAEMHSDVRGIRIGVPDRMLDAGVAPAVAGAISAALATFEGLGLRVETVSLPSLPAALPAYYVLAPAEASSNLARYDGVRYGRRAAGHDLTAMYAETRGRGFGAEVKRRIMLGTYVLSAGYYDAFYLTAQKVRRLVARDFAVALERVDVIVMPVAPTAAFSIGERADDPMTMYLSDVFTIPVSLAGLPALAVPCGFDGRLPIALQLVGRAFDESRLLSVGHAYQRVTDWHRRRPPVLH